MLISAISWWSAWDRSENCEKPAEVDFAWTMRPVDGTRCENQPKTIRTNGCILVSSPLSSGHGNSATVLRYCDAPCNVFHILADFCSQMSSHSSRLGSKQRSDTTECLYICMDEMQEGSIC